MAHTFYKDDDGLWWIDRQVIVPSNDIRLAVDNPSAPTRITVYSDTRFNGSIYINSELITDILDKNGTPYPDWATFKSEVRDFFSKASLQHTGISILNQGTLSIPDADTWTEITIVWDMHTDSKGFEMDLVNSVLIHTGENDTTYNFIGTSDVKSAKLSTIEYALVKNGDTANPIAISTHTFGNANSIESLSVTKAFNLMTGDTLNMYAKSSSSTNTLTIYSLDTTFWGDR